MTDSALATKKLIKKGGTRYPKYRLEDALVWGRKLVSRTHSGPQNHGVISAAVVESKGSTAEIKVSVLRQYGLLEGTSAAYTATELAKKIASSPPEDLGPLYKAAALSPPIFAELYNTFGSGEVAKSRLKQRASALKVHPDSVDECIDIYIASLTTAGLGNVDGDRFLQTDGPSLAVSEPLTPIIDEADQAQEATALDTAESGAGERMTPRRIDKARSTVTITVNIDASLDPEKLEKQLALLKRYGAI